MALHEDDTQAGQTIMLNDDWNWTKSNVWNNLCWLITYNFNELVTNADDDVEAVVDASDDDDDDDDDVAFCC